jgi:hypothetical protein
MWQKAVDAAEKIRKIDLPAACWIARSALRELKIKTGKKGRDEA